MTLGISIPSQGYKVGMNEGPATYGEVTIPASASKVTVACGELTQDSVIRIMQTTTSASTVGQLFEIKYDNSLLVRTTGNTGAFVVGSFGAQQTFTITPGAAPDAGTFTITFNGQTTSDLAYNASAADIQAALLLLSNMAPGGVIVTGTMATVVTIVFSAKMLLQDVPAPTSTSSLTASAVPVTLTVADTTTTFTNSVTFDWLVLKNT